MEGIWAGVSKPLMQIKVCVYTNHSIVPCVPVTAVSLLGQSLGGEFSLWPGQKYLQGHLEFTSAYDSKILYELFEAVVADTSSEFFLNKF